MADLPGARGADIVGGTMHTGPILRGARLLMTQPGIIDVTEADLTRAQRRRAQRDGREPSPVRVVRIRHPENRPTSATDTDRRYSRRWAVRGHWRRQWYPSRNDHRPIWINPHIKGPDGAPLSHQQTVHILDGGISSANEQGPRQDPR